MATMPEPPPHRSTWCAQGRIEDRIDMIPVVGGPDCAGGINGEVGRHLDAPASKTVHKAANVLFLLVPAGGFEPPTY